MPIFMDKHFVEGASIHEVNAAHEKDLAIENKYNLKFITYWFDPKRSTAFCLVDSPDKESIIKAHNEAHGLIPHQILEVNPEEIYSFLGRITHPEPVEKNKEPIIDSAYRVIMFTDIKNSTLKTSKLGDKKALHLIHIHNTITRDSLKEFNGQEIKHTGDGIMACFKSVNDAVESSMKIQNGFKTHNEKNPELKIFLKIGLSSGEPIEESGDFFGSAVQLSSRLCSYAKANEIIASNDIKNAYENNNASFISLGDITLKGFPEAKSVFKIY